MQYGFWDNDLCPKGNQFQYSDYEKKLRENTSRLYDEASIYAKTCFIQILIRL